MRRTLKGRSSLRVEGHSKQDVRAPVVVGVVVLFHTLAVGAAFLFIQGCNTTRGIGQTSVTPPPPPSLPPSEAPMQVASVTTPKWTPPPTTEPGPTDLSTGETYTIKKGDSLSKIAKRYGVSYRELAEINGITDPNKISIGQKIVLPAYAKKQSASDAASRTSTPASEPRAPSLSGGSYVVQAGDVLSKIAKRFGTSVAAIKKANNLSSDLIRVGDTLVIPGVDTSTETASASPSETSLPTLEPPPVMDTTEPSAFGELQPAASETAVTSIEPDLTASEEPLDYTVLTGDTVEDIAKLFIVSKDDLMQLNNLAAETDIKPGMKLLIPPPNL